jgi:hypothetical protein
LLLGLRSRSSLAAENLFLRKQLAFYQERKIKPLSLLKIPSEVDQAAAQIDFEFALKERIGSRSAGQMFDALLRSNKLRASHHQTRRSGNRPTIGKRRTGTNQAARRS